jgi:tetratricopeptide (TPR) repeat protein
MRLGRVLAAFASIVTLAAPRDVRADPPRSNARPEELERARALDQQGVRAFREGRYNDAIHYFDEAFKLGGPSSELWNIARCEVKLDDPEAASVALERYLACSDLSSEDRADARRELEELRRRPSIVTVASSPSGALVFVDGKRVGKTPTSVEVSAGEHALIVQSEGYSSFVDHRVARFGRAIIVNASLTGVPLQDGPTQGDATGRHHWVTASAEAFGLVARLGSLGRPIHPAALVSLGYVAFERGSIDVVTGARFLLTYDSWSNTVGTPAQPCGLGGPESATALALFADAAFGYRPLPRLRVGGDLGFGFASELGSQFGGDVFLPNCDASPGLVPAGHFGAEFSYAVLSALRVVFSPIVLEIAPAFAGTRSTPIDASGPWIRFGSGLGVAVDL